MKRDLINIKWSDVNNKNELRENKLSKHDVEETEDDDGEVK